eukprot:scaffold29224_cov18-Prasinocladus_malaysianus.AAC.1
MTIKALRVLLRVPLNASYHGAGSTVQPPRVLVQRHDPYSYSDMKINKARVLLLRVVATRTRTVSVPVQANS